MNSTTTNQRMVYGLAGALAAWGLYLAIGATGYFADAFSVKTSFQKSLIVLVCMAAFLGLWASVLSARRTDKTAVDTKPKGTSWSRSSLFAILCMAAAVVTWAGSINLWENPPPQNSVVLGWVTLTLMGFANVAAMIGLSDRRRLKGKFAALISLIAFVVCVIVFFVRSSGSSV